MIDPPRPFTEAFEASQARPLFICTLQEGAQPLAQCLAGVSQVSVDALAIGIGPEGDFTQKSPDAAPLGVRRKATTRSAEQPRAAPALFGIRTYLQDGRGKDAAPFRVRRFTPSEVRRCIALGGTPVRLGRVALRAETAAIVAVALVQHVLGVL